MKITKANFSDDDSTIEVKRFYLPFIVESDCPKCGLTLKKDLRNDYLSYPRLGKPESIHFFHDVGEYGQPGYEEHEWDVHVKLDLTLEPA